MRLSSTLVFGLQNPSTFLLSPLLPLPIFPSHLPHRRLLSNRGPLRIGRDTGKSTSKPEATVGPPSAASNRYHNKVSVFNNETPSLSPLSLNQRYPTQNPNSPFPSSSLENLICLTLLVSPFTNPTPLPPPLPTLRLLQHRRRRHTSPSFGHPGPFDYRTGTSTAIPSQPLTPLRPSSPTSPASTPVPTRRPFSFLISFDAVQQHGKPDYSHVAPPSHRHRRCPFPTVPHLRRRDHHHREISTVPQHRRTARTPQHRHQRLLLHPRHPCIEKMKLIRLVFRAKSDGVLRRFGWPLIGRPLSFHAASANNQSADSSESTEDFERRIFGEIPEGSSSSFFKQLERLPGGRYGRSSEVNGENEFGGRNGPDDFFTTLSDGMDDTLKDAATYFKMTDEVEEVDYSFRPDMNFQEDTTYETKDLDLTQPGVWKPKEPEEFEVTTAEVLQKADFRNVRFLANFITDAGIIIKRNKTKISAKAQRKVAREIKTARAFGLLPFTTMGTKAFVFGRTMENREEDYENYRLNSSVIGEDDAS